MIALAGTLLEAVNVLNGVADHVDVLLGRLSDLERPRVGVETLSRPHPTLGVLHGER